MNFVVPLMAFLAQDPVPSAEDVKPGWILAAVTIGLAVVSVLLWWSMRSRIGKVKFSDDTGDRADPRGQSGAGQSRAGQNDGPSDARADDEAGGSNPA